MVRSVGQFFDLTSLRGFREECEFVADHRPSIYTFQVARRTFVLFAKHYSCIGRLQKNHIYKVVYNTKSNT